MKISYDWLKDYVDLKVSPGELGKTLTMSGFSVESMEKFGADHILEIEVTANRPDILSVIGVAREVAAITGAKLKIPHIVHSPRSTVYSSKPLNTQYSILNTIRVEDAKLCPRYTGRLIRDVKVGDSPAWLKTRIEAMGLRPVNNIVDITNFCLFETGEPMHAFDLDRISGGEVIIRRARKGEKIVTIDGVERELDESVLVIADKMRAIAIAGVMGGLNTEVTFSTKNILLEAAYFDPVSIRRTSRKLGISSESSYRFERRVDIDNIIYSSDRASGLIHNIAGGRAGKIIDIAKSAGKNKLVSLRYSRLNKILGLEIPSAKARKILASLGLKTRSSAKDSIKLEIPSFRYDLEGEIDLIEEVARVHGYDKIPSTISNIMDQPVRMTKDMVIEKKIRAILTGLGLDEVITHNLLGKRLLNMTAVTGNGVVEIANPLSSEQEAMAPSLMIGMLNSIAWNINRKTKDLRLFELGKIYLSQAGHFAERKTLSIGMTGDVSSGWAGGARGCDFFDLKGALETLLVELGIDDYSIVKTHDDRFSSTACASIEINGKSIGMAGEMSPRISREFDIKSIIWFAEISVEDLIKNSKLEKRFQGLPKYPSVSRDISIVVENKVSNTAAVNVIKNAGAPLLKYVQLIDRYVGKQIPDGKVGLTYRLEYADPKRTLEDKDVSDLHTRILRELEGRLAAKLR